jgi:prepilin-type N-terminal cleavage/methylation domain-containing protein
MSISTVVETWRDPVKRVRPSDDSGFTLLEVITTCLLLGVLLTLGVGPWQSYRHARAHQEARTELVAALRHAQISAVAENVTYRVDISSKKAVVNRISASGTTQQGLYEIDDASVTFAGASFEQSSGVVSSSAYFYPRGSASKGDVTVNRSGRTKVYTVSVEGLTARVSFTQ